MILMLQTSITMIIVVWSGQPYTWLGNASDNSFSAPKRTKCGGVGYKFVV